jgi:hypothetical protein
VDFFGRENLCAINSLINARGGDALRASAPVRIYRLSYELYKLWLLAVSR